jgi:hypothetical protein
MTDDGGPAFPRCFSGKWDTVGNEQHVTNEGGTETVCSEEQALPPHPRGGAGDARTHNYPPR